VDFYVLQSLSVTAIVGLPDIIHSFLDTFVGMLRGASDPNLVD
jgi:hypothetical protein